MDAGLGRGHGTGDGDVPGLQERDGKIAGGAGQHRRHADPEHHHDAHGDDARAGAGGKEESAKPAGPGGVVGGMLGRFGRKKTEEPKDQPAAAAAGGPNSTLVMTGTTEVLSVATSVVSDRRLAAGGLQPEVVSDFGTRQFSPAQARGPIRGPAHCINSPHSVTLRPQAWMARLSPSRGTGWIAPPTPARRHGPVRYDPRVIVFASAHV